MLDREGGIQWPLSEGTEPGPQGRRLFENGRFFTADGRAKFWFGEPRPLPELPSPEFPFLLLTGRGSSSQLHTETRTKRSSVLRQLAPSELHVEVSPIDARALGIESDEIVEVRSMRGKVKARAFLTSSMRPGEVFLPMHDPHVNLLTLSVFDPESRQPAYKACAVKVEKASGKL